MSVFLQLLIGVCIGAIIAEIIIEVELLIEDVLRAMEQRKRNKEMAAIPFPQLGQYLAIDRNRETQE